MPISSKFLTESTGEKIVKIGQYISKIWTKYDSLVFMGHPVHSAMITITDIRPILSREKVAQRLYGLASGA